MSAYRETPPMAADAIVVYHANGKTGRWAAPLFFFSVFVLGVYVGLANVSTVHLRCVRVRGTCSIDTEWPIGTTHREISIGAISGARAEVSNGKNKAQSFRVVLDTTSGVLPLTLATAMTWTSPSPW
ncbi:MAG: hypothetical protein ABI461_03650 [Polyangiaceae bacterium]